MVASSELSGQMNIPYGEKGLLHCSTLWSDPSTLWISLKICFFFFNHLFDGLDSGVDLLYYHLCSILLSNLHCSKGLVPISSRDCIKHWFIFCRNIHRHCCSGGSVCWHGNPCCWPFHCEKVRLHQFFSFLIHISYQIRSYGSILISHALFTRKYTGRPQTQIPPYGPPSEQSYKDQHKIYHPNSLQSFGIHPKDMKSSEYLHDFDNQSQEGALTSSSGYAHIWERPLPEPMQLTDCPCSVADVRQSYSPMDGPPSYQHEGYQYNLVGGPTSVEIYRPATSDSMRRNTGNGLVYGNNTMARRELETGSFDPTRLGTTVEGKEPENARTQWDSTGCELCVVHIVQWHLSISSVIHNAHF